MLMTSLWKLTSADHSNVFVGLDVPLNQVLHIRVLRECLCSLCAARNNQELKIFLSGNLLSKTPSERALSTNWSVSGWVKRDIGDEFDPARASSDK
jgi:hypothetical protein